MTYYVTHHAAERARLRFGIEGHSVVEWINDVMKKAKYVSSQGNDRLLYEHKDMQIIVGGNSRKIITIHPNTRLDFLRPALEREIRKIKRETTRNIRAAERRLAKEYKELGERLINYANAKNPNTRDIVAERVSEKESIIKDLKLSIERMEDDLTAKVKAIEVITE